jgi:maleamate amidohydrolase
MTGRVWDSFLTDEDKKVFAAAGYGTRAAPGKRPVVLVIDVVYGFTGERDEPILQSIKTWPNSCGQYAWRAMPHLQRLLDAARRKGLPIVYTTTGFRNDAWDIGSWSWKNGRSGEWEAGSDGKQNRNGSDIVDEIAPQPKDLVLYKLKPSAFHGTPLKSLLTLLNADSLIVTGTTTSGCVRASVIDAFSENLRVMMMEEGCFDRSQASHAINLCDMNAKYADVLPATEVLTYIESLPPGLFDLPSGANGGFARLVSSAP